MSADSYVAKNKAERERLRALCARMSDGDLGRMLASGWTAAITLAHVGFWDGQAAAILDGWRAIPPGERADRVRGPLFIGAVAAPWIEAGISEAALATIPVARLNDILVPRWAALAPRDTARLALDAASDADAVIAALDPPLIQELREAGRGWMLDAWAHRAEHLDEIEAALGWPPRADP